jgi:CheY-like chemotaxis protein
MTADKAFECLLVSRDPDVVSVMNKLLGDFAISTKVIPTSATAVDYLAEGSTDLVIVDWQKDYSEVLRHINRSGQLQKPVAMVVSDLPNPVPGTYSLLRKPVTVESGAQSLKQVYSQLLQDYRRHTRYALLNSLIARNQYGRSVPVIVLNIGEAGVGLSTVEFLSPGDVLSLSLPLPGNDVPIAIEARVLWVRQYGAAGCGFVSIPQADRRRLDDWMKQKCQVKKPLVDF